MNPLVYLALALPVVAAQAPAQSPTKPSAKIDPKYPFRVGWANEHLPWYQLKKDEFPPSHSDNRMSGELIKVDPIRREGQFRLIKTGETVDFRLLPYGTVVYCGSPADIRDVPLGTRMLFSLYQDEKGAFTQVAWMMDEFTILSSHSFTYRLDAVDLAGGKITVTQQSIPKKTVSPSNAVLLVDDNTRVWKGKGEGALADLAVGQALLVNLAPAAAPSRGRCTDIWVDDESQKFVMEQQRAKFLASLKERGLPGRVDRAKGDRLVMTLFAGPEGSFKKDIKALVTENFGVDRRTTVVVADESLRTYDPPVDGKAAKLLEIQSVPADGYGCSGVRLVLEPSLLLEGYRAGRVVRIFSDKWPVKAMPSDERLFP